MAPRKGDRLTEDTPRHIESNEAGSITLFIGVRRITLFIGVRRGLLPAISGRCRAGKEKESADF